MENAKKQISDNLGERLQFGNIYISELVQQGAHYAVGEINVTYENTSIVYLVTFNEDMLLSGLYMR